MMKAGWEKKKMATPRAMESSGSKQQSSFWAVAAGALTGMAVGVAGAWYMFAVRGRAQKEKPSLPAFNLCPSDLAPLASIELGSDACRELFSLEFHAHVFLNHGSYGGRLRVLVFDTIVRGNTHVFSHCRCFGGCPSFFTFFFPSSPSPLSLSITDLSSRQLLPNLSRTSTTIYNK